MGTGQDRIYGGDFARDAFLTKINDDIEELFRKVDQIIVDQGIVPVENPLPGELGTFVTPYTMKGTPATDVSGGVADAGKVVLLGPAGVIDESLLGKSKFIFIGDFTPVSGTEYPDTTGLEYGSYWQIVGVDDTNGYTYTGGDLAGETVYNRDKIAWMEFGWALVGADYDPTNYYRLDGTFPITAPFQAAGHKLVNVGSPTEDTDAVNMGYGNAKWVQKVGGSYGGKMTGDLHLIYVKPRFNLDTTDPLSQTALIAFKHNGTNRYQIVLTTAGGLNFSRFDAAGAFQDDVLELMGDGTIKVVVPPECSVAPTTDNHLANKAYVDSMAGGGGILPVNSPAAGEFGRFTSDHEMEGLTASELLSAINVEAGADKTDADNVAAAGAAMLDGAAFTGDVSFDQVPTCSTEPTADGELANKLYVDTHGGGGGGIVPVDGPVNGEIGQFASGTSMRGLTAAEVRSLLEVERYADQTDAANVAAAGAAMLAGADFTGNVSVAGSFLANVLSGKLGAVRESFYSFSNSGSAITINVQNGTTFHVVFDASCTVNFTGANESGTYSFILIAVGGGSHSINWPSNIYWDGGGEPTLTQRDVLTFFSYDQGANWFGSHVMKDLARHA